MASIGPYRTGSRERFGPGGVNRRRTKKREETCSTPARFSFFVPRPHLWGSQGAGPLGRASRAIGSSGHLFRFLFGCPKRKDYRVVSHYKRLPPQGGGKRQPQNKSIHRPSGSKQPLHFIRQLPMLRHHQVRVNGQKRLGFFLGHFQRAGVLHQIRHP